ncbi:sodium:calcium antiporter [Acidihalobacter prosperus]
MIWLIGILALSGILLGSELFTNALEHLGEHYGFSEGAVGSIFAAVGTALPEAMVPIIALFSANVASVGQAVSVGAILGAPLMISTLSFGVLGLFTLVHRRPGKSLKPAPYGLTRDLVWFQVLFATAALALFIPVEDHFFRIVASLILVAGYIAYVLATLRISGELTEAGQGVTTDNKLYTSRLWGQGIVQVYLQLFLGVGVIVWSAHFFVNAVEALASSLHVPVLVLSLLLVPVATELPEKINSLLWAKQGKDTLAVGNLSGALVFQGSLLPALGLWLTPWRPNRDLLYAIIITFIAVSWLHLANRRRGLHPVWLLANAGFYITYFYFLTN